MACGDVACIRSVIQQDPPFSGCAIQNRDTRLYVVIISHDGEQHAFSVRKVGGKTIAVLLAFTVRIGEDLRCPALGGDAGQA